MFARGERREPALVDAVEGGEAGEVTVDRHHLGVHPGGDRRGVRSGDAGPDHDDSAGATPGTPLSNTPRPPEGALEMRRPGDRRHPTGDLAHRREQRQGAVRQPDGLVGDRRRSAVDDRLGAVPVGGEVEVGEQHEPVAQARELLLDRLFHLADELGFAPELVRVGDDPGADPQVVGVGEGRAFAGGVLDEDGVARGDELAHARRGHRDPVFAFFQLPRDADAARVSFETSSQPASCQGALGAASNRGSGASVFGRQGVVSRVSSKARVLERGLAGTDPFEGVFEFDEHLPHAIGVVLGGGGGHEVAGEDLGTRVDEPAEADRPAGELGAVRRQRERGEVMGAVDDLGGESLVERLGAEPGVARDDTAEWWPFDESERSDEEVLGGVRFGAARRGEGAPCPHRVAGDRGVEGELVATAREEGPPVGTGAESRARRC